MIVVKIGGSLFDHPQLGPGLRAYLDSLAPTPVLLVPGGGDVVEAIRRLDAIHGLGEEVSHRLALTGLWVTAAFLREMIPGVEYGCHPAADPAIPVRVLDSKAFCQINEGLPHSWDVTSDSIAARAAVVYGAERLVLLKSVDVPAGTKWETAVAHGWVDPYFPQLMAGTALAVEFVNFRRVLDSLE